MDKNKTGKYLKYAIGEIALVVFGILIALQVNTWNEDRKFKEESIIITQVLNSEFSDNRIVSSLCTLVDFNKFAAL